MSLPIFIRNASIRGMRMVTVSHNNISFQTTRKLTCFNKQPNEQILKTISSLNSNNVIAGKRNMSADHSKLWPIEKAISILLVGVVPAAIACPCTALDNILAISTVAHFHWGLEACIVDYIRPIIFGSAIPKLALGLLYLVSAVTLGGLLYYNHSSIGIGKTIRKIWAIKE